jgi:Cdc6-like AAA superfamily ATPase
MSAPPPRVGSATTSPAEQLVGRLAEREAVDRLLDTARGGYGSVLVVNGDRGVGKTALLEYAVQSARSGSVRGARTGRAAGDR